MKEEGREDRHSLTYSPPPPHHPHHVSVSPFTLPPLLFTSQSSRHNLSSHSAFTRNHACTHTGPGAFFNRCNLDVTLNIVRLCEMCIACMCGMQYTLPWCVGVKVSSVKSFFFGCCYLRCECSDITVCVAAISIFTCLDLRVSTCMC